MNNRAMSSVMKGYKVETNETLLELYYSNQWPDASEYLGRKKSKGLQEGTIYQYKYVLTPFAQYTQKPLGKVVEVDVRRFLDKYEGFNESNGDG